MSKPKTQLKVISTTDLVEPKICSECHLPIKENQRYVDLGTFEDRNGKKVEIERVYFHIQCWAVYFDTRVKNKLNAYKNQAMDMLGNALNAMEAHQANSKLKNY